MSSTEPLTSTERLPEANPSDSFVSSGSDWDLLGDLMIDLGDQTPLKMQNASVENMAPKSDNEKGLKMKIKRKSKNEEKHEIVTPDMEKQKQQLASVKAEESESAPNAKKARVDKQSDSSKRKGPAQSHRRDAAVNTVTVGTSVEPDSLGPCESGTSIGLDGIVWLETNTGVLIVNVTWRGRAYVGTLLDSSQHDFSPPCPKDYVPPMEAQRNARGRGKRRGGSNSQAGARGRRLGRQLPLSGKGDESEDSKDEQPNIRCPELGCEKRFCDMQALKWHHISQHCDPKPYYVHDPARITPAHLIAEKSADGSCVFKVPQAKQGHHPTPAGHKGSPPKTVTVSKTCPVPQGHQKCKREEKTPPAGNLKPIQPKSAGQEHDEQREHRKKRRSPSLDRQLPGTKPQAGCAIQNGGSPRKPVKKSDPVSPAYSDISDEGGSAPSLEKEETASRQHAPQQQPQQQQQSQHQPQQQHHQSPQHHQHHHLQHQPQHQHQPHQHPQHQHQPHQHPQHQHQHQPHQHPHQHPQHQHQHHQHPQHQHQHQHPRPRSRDTPRPAAPGKAARTPSRGSPSLPKPSLGHSPSEDAKQERQQPQAESDHHRDTRPQASPSARPGESPRRPGSRQSAPNFVSPLPHMYPGVDYRFLSPAAPLAPFGVPPYPPMDKTALEALNQYAAANSRGLQHKIHELAARAQSPGSRKSPPQALPAAAAAAMGHHYPHRPQGLDPFAGLGPPYSVASPMMGHPSHHFMPK